MMDTKTLSAILGPLVAVGLGAGNVYQAQSPPDCSESVSRWEKQLTEAHEQCNAREIRVRDYCIDTIERLRARPSGSVLRGAVLASWEPVLLDCPPWPCEDDYQCGPECSCNEYGDCE